MVEGWAFPKAKVKAQAKEEGVGVPWECWAMNLGAADSRDCAWEEREVSLLGIGTFFTLSLAGHVSLNKQQNK